jgi:hypothetical protein
MIHQSLAIRSGVYVAVILGSENRLGQDRATVERTLSSAIADENR